MVELRCSPETCRPAWRDSWISWEAAAGHVGERVAFELFLGRDLAHVLDRAGAAEGFDELVGRAVQAGELEQLDDQQRPGEHGREQQAEHHDLNDPARFHEHGDRGDAAAAMAARGRFAARRFRGGGGFRVRRRSGGGRVGGGLGGGRAGGAGAAPGAAAS
jgi:hypothetical protein